MVAKGRAEGRLYWTKRGIAIGAKVYAITHNMLMPLVTARVEGIAKVGAAGAYVLSKQQRGKLDPAYFNAA